MSVPETNLSRFSEGIFRTQERVSELQTMAENERLAGRHVEAARYDAEMRREASKMKRYELYTKFWEAALEVGFFLMGIATNILKIRV